MKKLVQIIFLVLVAGVLNAQKPLFKFGEEVGFEKITSGQKIKGQPVQWIQVNTEDDTCTVKGK